MSNSTTPSPEDYAKLIELYRSDVSIFAQQVFDFTLSEKQREIADGVQNNVLVTVRGAISVGKSAVMAIIAWHNLICYPEVLVTLWGPNEGNLRDGVISAMRQFYDKMAEPFKSLYECLQERFQRRMNPSSCYAQMRLASKDRPDAARGLHQKRCVVLCDEATEIDDAVLAILMNVIGDLDPHVLLISNPSSREGFFARTHLDPDISKDWIRIHATIEDAPNYDPAKTAKLASQYGGKTTSRYRCMILGEFPLSDIDGLIPREVIETAIGNTDVVPATNIAPVWSVDPAGAGKDSSVLCIRHDNKVLDFHDWQGLDPTQLSFKILDLFKQTPAKMRPSVIAVDSTGLGNGVYSNLREFGLPVHSCIFAGTPTRNPDRYHRIRDQIYFEMREWFMSENCSIPNHARLVEELATVTYDDGSGKIKLEDKKALKKRLGRSPDYADALAISFAPSQSRFNAKYGWNKPIQYHDTRSFE